MKDRQPIRILVLPVLLVCSVFFVSDETYSQATVLVNAFPNLAFTQPVFLTHANDGTNRIFVVQQNGLIRVFPNDSAVTSARTFLNLSSRISTASERGLLGLAFHPNYATNGYFYVDYTQAGTGRTIIARYSVNPANPDTALFNSEFILLNIYQPFSNHNGGMVMFGQDGYFYIGMGDGGSGCDPGNRAQNLDSLLGKILRISVDTVTATTNYGIPPDNPLVGSGHREEIYAWGLRNPWRFSQDPVTGEIWVGDVGQDSWEEIDSLGKGRNYGWRNYEGLHCPTTCSGVICNPAGLTFPVKEYLNSVDCSVTGGYIYRGYRRADLTGRYIYGDYCTGNIWQFRYQNGQLTSDSLLIDAPFSISSFGVDQYYELYICNYGGNIQRFAGTPLTLTTTQVSPINGSQNVSMPTELRWRRAPSAINYWLEVATDPGFSSFVVFDSTLTDTTYIANGLAPGTSYYWRVRVKNPFGWGNFSPPWSFKTGTVSAQVNLEHPPNSYNTPSRILSFRWRAAANAQNYWFENSLDSTFSNVAHQDTALADTTLTVSDIIADTNYYWHVRGRGSGGLGPYSDRWGFTSYRLPSQVVLVSPADSSVSRPDSVEFQWRSVSNAIGYWFELARDTSFQDLVERDTTVVDTTKLVRNLLQLTGHYWRVRAKSMGGYGSFSSVRYFFTQEILAVEENLMPKEFALYQNYPNPFNPTTRISYDLPKQSSVRLSISNMLGQQIRVLYEGIQQAGGHSMEFDADGLPSGVYFYKLEAQPLDAGLTGGFRSVRKMLLMK